MVSQEIIFAGFGGQGVLSIGKLIAFAGLDQGLNVSWLPSYGPEMRGGTANCSVILTDGSVGSPIVTDPDTLIVMNGPSLDKFEDHLKNGGLLIIDSDLVNRALKRKDIQAIKIPAQTIAEDLGSNAIANMVLLGAFVTRTNVVSMQVVLKALKEHGKEQFYNINKEALKRGSQYA